MSAISNSNDIINVCDITDRVEELRDEREALSLDYDDAQEALNHAKRGKPGTNLGTAEADVAAAKEAIEAWDASEVGIEYGRLVVLLSALCGYGGDHQWEGNWYPGALIRDTYFVDYARDLVEDLYAPDRNYPDFLVIDWVATAKNIRVDYACVEYDGVAYWYR